MVFLYILRKVSNKKFINDIKDLIFTEESIDKTEKQILIIQLGPDYIVGKAIQNIFVDKDGKTEIRSLEKNNINKYDIVIVLNYLFRKKEYLRYLENILRTLENTFSKTV